MSKPTKKELEQQREQIASKLSELEKQQQALQKSIDGLKESKLDTTDLEQMLAMVESEIVQAKKDLDEIDAKLATLALGADSSDEDSGTPKPDDQDAPGATKKMPPVKPKSETKKKLSLWFWLALVLAVLTLGATTAQALATGSLLPTTNVWDTTESTSISDPAPDTTDSTTSSEPVSEEVVQEAQAQMTVDLDEIQASEFDSVVNGDWSLLWYSLSTWDTVRAHDSGISDAVSIPFSSSTDESIIYNELQQEILRNPVYGIGMLDFLDGIQVGDQTIGDLNPWMAEVIARNEDGGCNNWIQYGADGTTIEVTPEYRIYASGICTLLNRMVSEGIGEFRTTENWCLNLALLNSDRKMIKSSYEYQGDFIVYTYFGKDGEGLLRIGFNLRDKRPALLTELEEATPVTPDTTDPIDPPYVPPTPPTPPTPPDPPVPPTPPDPPVPPTPPDPPDPGDDPTKDPTKDPDAQGNADKGGGVNDDPGPGKYEDQHESTSTGSSSVTGNNGSAGNSTTGPVGGSSTDTGSTPPATDPIPPVDSSTGTDNATGESGDTANDENTGTIVMPD